MTYDRLALEDFSPAGAAPVVVLDLGDAATAAAAAALRAAPALVIGADRRGDLPAVATADFDILLTARSEAPVPWVSSDDIGRTEQRLTDAVRASPVAAATLGQVLRLGETLSFGDALTVESLAYSALLGGQAFRDWRAAHPPRDGRPPSADLVLYDRTGDRVTLTLNRPEARNAVGAAMRDALFQALAAVLDDPTRPTLELIGAGPSFSAGGDLDEFGTATDLGFAHIVRRMRYPAALLHELGDRASVRMHGACIGAGIEIGAAAARRTARNDAFFQLPEIAMGLIPGAGGTITVSRAIGRHRTAYMAVSGERITPATALGWSLIHAIVEE